MFLLALRLASFSVPWSFVLQARYQSHVLRARPYFAQSVWGGGRFCKWSSHSRNEIIVFGQLILRMVNYELQGRVLCFARVGKALVKMSVVWSILRPSRKNEISPSICHKSSVQMTKILFPWQTNCFIKISAARHSRLELFPLLGKVLCIGGVGKSLVKCLLSAALR